MATYQDPVQCFAPIEVLERLLEIRSELGFSKSIYMPSSTELMDYLDAYGFDTYAFSIENKEINYGDYRSQLVPGGDNFQSSLKTH